MVRACVGSHAGANGRANAVVRKIDRRSPILMNTKHSRFIRSAFSFTMGLIGFVAEIAVLLCIIGGVVSNAYVCATCDMLRLGNGFGEIGPWRADISGLTNGCVSWNKAQTDDWIIKMGRATSMMALCFGVIFLVVGFIHQCCCKFPFAQCLLNISGTCITLSLALVWPMIRSDTCTQYGCTWGGGATALVLSMIFYFAASIFACFMREPRYVRNEQRD